MKWTSDPPTTLGYYWVRYPGLNETRRIICISSFDFLKEKTVQYGTQNLPKEMFEFCYIPTPLE